MRFGMLEMVREFAEERLVASGEREALRARHAAYFTELVDRVQPGYYTATTPLTRQFEDERDNVRAALAWEAEREETGLLVRLALAEWWWWDPSEGFRWLERAVELTPRSDFKQRALLLALLGTFGMIWKGSAIDAELKPLIEEGLAIGRDIGDTRVIGLATQPLCMFALNEGDIDLALALIEESVTAWQSLAEPNCRVGLAQSLAAYIVVQRGDLARAEALATAGLAQARAVGAELAIASVAEFLGSYIRARGDLGQAASLYAESLTIVRDGRGPMTVSLCLKSLGAVAATVGRAESAIRLFGASEAARERHGFAILSAIEEESLRQDIAPARAKLSAAAFAAAWAAGRSLTLDQAVAEALTVAEAVTAGASSDPATGHGLTPREREVLSLLAAGQSNREIAARLHLSERTVESHVLHVLTKLDLPSRTAAAGWAIRQGLA